MIKKITLFVFATAICLGISSFKAEKKVTEDDPNVGFYVDGVKVNELTCYSFKTLTVVAPYNAANNAYAQFVIESYIPGAEYEPDCGIFNINSKTAFLSRYVKGNYIIYELYSENAQEANSNGGLAQIMMSNGAKSPARYHLNRSALAYYPEKDKPEEFLEINIWGQVISGYEDSYDANTGTATKTPVYKTEQIGTPLKIALKNRVYNKKPFKMKVEFTTPCAITGTKVDFNNLSK